MDIYFLETSLSVKAAHKIQLQYKITVKNTILYFLDHHESEMNQTTLTSGPLTTGATSSATSTVVQV